MKKFKRFNLYTASLIGNALYISSGMAMTWTVPTVPKLKEQPNLNDTQIAWLTSLAALGAICGPFLYAAGVDWIGRKWTLLLNGVVFLISWFTLTWSRFNLPFIYFGRLMAGLGAGATCNTIPIYLTEISEDEVRQAITSSSEIFYALGFLYTYSIGPYVSYEWISGWDAVPTLLFIAAMLFMPETPYYLISRGDVEGAKKSLRWLRRQYDVSDELNTIQLAVLDAKENNGRLIDLFRNRGPRRALILSIYIMALQQLSAIDVVTSYAEQIFSSVNLNANTCGLVVAGFNLISAILAPPLVKKFGAKPILIYTAFLCALSNLSFGIYKCLDDNGYNLESFYLMPVICVVLFNIGYCLGFGSIPWAIIAELFPTSLKGAAVMMTSSLAWFFDFVVMLSFGQLVDRLGAGSIFIFYGISVIVGTVIMIFVVPDTRNMPLAQILAILE